MKSFLKKNGLVLSLYTVLMLIALYFIFSFEKNSIHLYLNQYVGNRYINAFFFTADHLGDGWMAPVLVLAVSIVNVRAGVYTACALILGSSITTALKYLAFDDVHRPLFIFQYYDRHDLNLVDGVHVNIHNSFPSGHATQTFAIFMSMLFFAGKKLFKVLLFLAATLGAFSRVYLSQHWLEDIVAGSLIGTSCSLIMYYLFIHRDNLSLLDRPLTDLFTRRES